MSITYQETTDGIGPSADNATLELIDVDEPRLLWEFWAEVAADGNVKLKADLDFNGDYGDPADYTYTISASLCRLSAIMGHRMG